MKYRVERHGGRVDNDWRLVFKTDELGKAQEKYNKFAETIRQGGVRILLEDSKIVICEYSAPRIRSKW
jgi:hypothetical protein